MNRPIIAATIALLLLVGGVFAFIVMDEEAPSLADGSSEIDVSADSSGAKTSSDPQKATPDQDQGSNTSERKSDSSTPIEKPVDLVVGGNKTKLPKPNKRDKISDKKAENQKRIDKIRKAKRKAASELEKKLQNAFRPKNSEKDEPGPEEDLAILNPNYADTSFTVDGQEGEGYFKFSKSFSGYDGRRLKGGAVIGPFIVLHSDQRDGVHVFEKASGLYCGKIASNPGMRIEGSEIAKHIGWDEERQELNFGDYSQAHFETARRLPSGFFEPVRKSNYSFRKPLAFLANGYEAVYVNSKNEPEIFNLRTQEKRSFDRTLQLASTIYTSAATALSRDKRFLALRNVEDAYSLYDLEEARYMREISLGSESRKTPRSSTLDADQGVLYCLFSGELKAFSYRQDSVSLPATIKSFENAKHSVGLISLCDGGRKVLLTDRNSSASFTFLDTSSGNHSAFKNAFEPRFTPFIDSDGESLWFLEDSGLALSKVSVSGDLSQFPSGKNKKKKKKSNTLVSMRTLQPAAALSPDGSKLLSLDMRGLVRGWKLKGLRTKIFLSDTFERRRSFIDERFGLEAGYSLEDRNHAEFALVGNRRNLYELSVEFSSRLSMQTKRDLELIPESRIESLEQGHNREFRIDFDQGGSLTFEKTHLSFEYIIEEKEREETIIEFADGDNIVDGWTLEDGSLILFTPQRVLRIYKNADVKVAALPGHWSYNPQVKVLINRQDKQVTIYSLDLKLLHALKSKERIQSAAINATMTRAVGIHVDSGLSVWDLPKLERSETIGD